MTNTELKHKYFAEAARALRRDGYDVSWLPNGELLVEMDDTTLCELNGIGSITFSGHDISSPERITAKDRVFDIICTVSEYVRQMERSPPLEAEGLDSGFKLLSEFNNTVLAGKETKHGMQFVTWDRDFNRTGLSYGHYHMDDYKGAKVDFAVRSGLIQEQQLFSDLQLMEVYRCCEDTLQDTYVLTDNQRNSIKEVQTQIEHLIPNIKERIQQQDQTQLEKENTFTLTQG